MTRAVRVWAALSEFERDVARGSHPADYPPLADVLAALDADLADHEALTRAAQALDAEPYQAFLIHERDAGPRTPAERCDDCGEDVTTGRVGLYDFDARRQLWLGPGCWRDRMLKRRRGGDVPGDQLQVFPTPYPIRED